MTTFAWHEILAYILAGVFMTWIAWAPIYFTALAFHKFLGRA